MKVFAISFVYLFNSLSISKCVDVADAEFVRKNCFSSTCPLVLYWPHWLHFPQIRAFQYWFYSLLCFTIFYNTQSDSSHELTLNFCHISERISSLIHFSESLWIRRSLMGICLSTTVMNIKWKDVHILLMSGSDLREFQSTELRLLKKSGVFFI